MPRKALAIGEHGAITLTQKAPKLWEGTCRVRDADGKIRQIRREATTKQAANKAVQQALADRPGFSHSGIDSDTRVRVVAEQWLARTEAKVEQGALAPNTARVYRSVWTNHLAVAVGELRVREATAGRLDDFLVTLRAHQSASVTQTARTILSAVLGLAVREGALAHNPIREVSAIPGGAQKEPRALTAGEREQWLNKLDEDYLARHHDILDMTRFMLSTGVRIGECLAVTFDDVDFADGTVRIDHGITRVIGHGLVRGRTKTRAGARTLRLTPWTLQMLEERYMMLGEGPVFPSSTRTWRDPSNTGRQFRAARQRAGFDWLTTHAFRKTAATVMDEGGLTAREIADHIGHSRISMTQDVYMGRRVATDRAVSALAAAEVWEGRNAAPREP